MITGDKELIAKFQSLKKTDAKAAVRKGSRAGCKELLPAVRAATPVLTGQAAANVRVRALPRSRRWTGTRVTIGFTGPTFYLGFVEWGTKQRRTKGGANRGSVTARHFMRTVVDDKGDTAVQTAMQIIASEIKTRMKA